MIRDTHLYLPDGDFIQLTMEQTNTFLEQRESRLEGYE